MKVRFWVVSARGTSLRDSLNNDLTKDRTRKTNRYPVRLQQQQKIDRPEGWS